MTPLSSTAIAGGTPITLSATVTNTTETVQWTLTGPGAISNKAGLSTQYTPPASVGAATTATVQASLTNAKLSASSKITVNPAPVNPGVLEVGIIGLPAVTDANVTVTGPGGFSQPITASKTITSLAPGAYTLAAGNVTSGGIVYAASITGSPATVSAGATAKASVSYAPQIGSLKLNITGLPNGVKANVTLSGPNGFSQTLTTTSVLSNLAPGIYALTEATVRAVGSIVDLVLEGTGPDSVSVTVGTTATASVHYAARPGTPALWLPKVGGSVIAYAASNLGFGGNSLAQPNITLSGAAGGGNGSVAFDPQGNLWTLNSAANTLQRFNAAQLGSSGTPTPVITITSSAGWLSRPAGLAFDRNGNLWIANLGNDTIVMYSPARLAQSGSQAPNTILTAVSNGLSNSLNGPSSLAFDAKGDLWVLNGASPETLVMFTPDQLASGPGLAPVQTIYLSVSAGSSMAFDAQGGLWVTDFGGNAVVKYAATQLTQSHPSPAAFIHTINGSLSNPAGLAFDSSGNLWVVNTGNNTLVEFAVDTLPATPSADSPDTASVISDIRDLPLGSIAFNPAPLGLPLAH